MQITRTGSDKVITVPRIKTGFYSFDWAFIDNLGNTGLPLRSIIEITGEEGVGKSTVMFSLAGVVAKEAERDVYLLDLERQNQATVETSMSTSGFIGNLLWETYEPEFIADDAKQTQKSKKTGDKSPEDYLDGIVHMSRMKTPKVIMMDSLAAWNFSGALEGSVGAVDMGTKAKILRKWFGQMMIPLNGNPTPPIMFFTNHLTQKVGAFRPSPQAPIPMQSTGGTSVGYYSTQVMELKKLYGWSYPEQHGYVIEGKLRKNRDGYGIESKQVFYLYLQAGEGINKNLTAVVDCVMTGLAKSSSKGLTDSSKVTMGNTDFGKFRDMIDNRFDPDFFKPFHQALAEQSGGIQEVSNEIGE